MSPDGNGAYDLSDDYIILDIEERHRQPPGWYAGLEEWQRVRLLAMWHARHAMTQPQPRAVAPAVPVAPDRRAARPATPDEAPDASAGRQRTGPVPFRSSGVVLRHPGNPPT